MLKKKKKLSAETGLAYPSYYTLLIKKMKQLDVNVSQPALLWDHHLNLAIPHLVNLTQMVLEI